MADVALRLAQIVRLDQLLAGQQLVGDLGIAAVRVGVVHNGSLRRPVDEGPSLTLGHVAGVLQHLRVALRVDQHRAHPVLDRVHGDPGHRDRLTRAGGAEDERMGAARRSAERDPNETAVLHVLADQQLRLPGTTTLHC